MNEADKIIEAPGRSQNMVRYGTVGGSIIKATPPRHSFKTSRVWPELI
jgi:hypothetical protein